MRFKAVLFDLDGTLINSLADISNSMNRVLSQCGFPTHDMNDYRYFVGNGVTMLIRRALPENKRTSAIIDSCRKSYDEIYTQNWDVYTNSYDGIPAMLDELTMLGIKMAILSNKPQSFAELCVNRFLSSWTFEIVIGQRDSLPPKPDPSGALEISRLMGISASNYLYLGDSSIDIQTAIAAGMFPVGALWGFRTKEELLMSGAKEIISSPMDILNLIK